MRTVPSVARAAAALLVVAWVAFFLAVRRGWTPFRPEVLAGLAGAAGIAVASMAALALPRAARGPRRWTAVAESLLACGFLVVVVGGLVNWARGFQGFVAVAEREPVKLTQTSLLGAFQAGPLADLRELDLTIALARLRMEPAGADGFQAVSRLKVLDAKGEEVGLDLSLARGERIGAVVFRQGAFGFAPRISIRRGGVLLLDRYVPFRTVREGPEGLAFLGEFEIESESLVARGALTLDDLNEDMKGHPKLELELETKPDPVAVKLGTGKLKPGDFATISGGYTIGFSGLQRWSEIDFARRNYTAPMLGGFAVFALGALLWPLAAWRRW